MDSLPELVRRLGEVLGPRTGKYEAILVNDGSRDASSAVIAALAREHSWIRGLELLRNYGQHNATLAGIRAARNDIIVTIDDDLQHPPEEVPNLLAKLAEGYDVVYGTPDRRKHGLLRNIASRFTRLALEQTMRVSVARQAGAFRAFRTELREAFASYSSPYVVIDVLLTWGSSRFGATVVRHDVRPYGRSNYRFSRLLLHALNLITGFSTLPLRIASFVGFFFTLIGFGLLIYVLAAHIVHGVGVPGFTFLAAVLTLFSGIQLFALGLHGEYLARIHHRTMERPAYVVRDQPSNALTNSAGSLTRG
jgi:undecaprenyl-phosphate 4-deoxy-4-formamido-L-arabinose transferase